MPGNDALLFREPARLHSPAWIFFTYVSFCASVGMVAIGMLFAPVDVWIKACLAMGAALLIQSCITMTKMLRDVKPHACRMNAVFCGYGSRVSLAFARSPGTTI